jgi:hypothetical protein
LNKKMKKEEDRKQAKKARRMMRESHQQSSLASPSMVDSNITSTVQTKPSPVKETVNAQAKANVAVLSGGNSARFVANKASSTWRRGDSKPRAGGGLAVTLTTVPSLTMAKGKPRSSSLNPLIYPSWWGDDVKEFKQAILKRDKSQVTGGIQSRKPEIIRAGKKVPGGNSLEQRMKDAQERVVHQ